MEEYGEYSVDTSERIPGKNLGGISGAISGEILEGILVKSLEEYLEESMEEFLEPLEKFLEEFLQGRMFKEILEETPLNSSREIFVEISGRIPVGISVGVPGEISRKNTAEIYLRYFEI